jgi:dTDP-glucose 4,6-dehydratase
MAEILVLGSNSFSGNAYVAELSKTHRVVAVSRSARLNPALDRLTASSHLDNIDFEQWNLNEDPDKIIDLILEREIKTVINFAAQSMVGQSWEFPEDWYQANVTSFSKLLTKLSKVAQLDKFIQFTTPEVYGSTDGWVTENFNFAPNTPYAISRAAGDWHLKALYDNFGFPVVFTRAANVYGSGQPLYRIIPRVIVSALTGRKIPLQGGGKSVRSFIHIQDVNSALKAIQNLGIPGESYHISTNSLVTIRELVEVIAVKLGIDFEDLVEITPDRPGKDFAYQLDSTKIRSELLWEDTISLSQGIDLTIDWAKGNIEELSSMPLDYKHRK